MPRRTKRAAASPAVKESEKGAAPLSSAWKKAPEVATAAMVGSIVALVLSPVSQSLTYYITRALSKPVLSIEYVETVFTASQHASAVSSFQSLMHMAGFFQYASLNTQSTLAVLSSRSSPEATKQILSLLETIATDVRQRMQKLESTKSAIANESDDAKLVTAIAEAVGPVFQSMPFSTEPPSDMKVSFVRYVDNDLEAGIALQAKLTSIRADLQKPPDQIEHSHFRVSILNRGDTDGLVRSTGKLEFAQAPTAVAIVRVAPPKLPSQGPAEPSVAVSVMNQVETPRESSVGKVEKRTMTEFWFRIDADKLTEAAKPALEAALQAKKSFRILLSDQEMSPITLSDAGRNS